MKYKIGDKLLIKSKILPKSAWDCSGNYIRVCTSCNNGHDRFKTDGLTIEDGYVIHEVEVTDFDTYSDGHKTYYCSNNLSVTGMGWQGVADCDVLRKINDDEKGNFSKKKENNIVKQPINWYTLWKRLGKQPLYKTQHNKVKIKIDGEFYECAIVYDDNGSDFHLETMENLQIKRG